MSDYDHRTINEDFFKRFLNQIFGLSVERRSCFVLKFDSIDQWNDDQDEKTLNSPKSKYSDCEESLGSARLVVFGLLITWFLVRRLWFHIFRVNFRWTNWRWPFVLLEKQVVQVVLWKWFRLFPNVRKRCFHKSTKRKEPVLAEPFRCSIEAKKSSNSWSERRRFEFLRNSVRKNEAKVVRPSIFPNRNFRKSPKLFRPERWAKSFPKPRLRAASDTEKWSNRIWCLSASTNQAKQFRRRVFYRFSTKTNFRSVFRPKSPKPIDFFRRFEEREKKISETVFHLDFPTNEKMKRFTSPRRRALIPDEKKTNRKSKLRPSNRRKMSTFFSSFQFSRRTQNA